ncbi:hypothetical protein VTI74DRAFT_5016 [Chaetomium olivicolor]
MMPEGPISSVKDLRQPTEMHSVPEILEITVIAENGISTTKPVKWRSDHLSRSNYLIKGRYVEDPSVTKQELDD